MAVKKLKNFSCPFCGSTEFVKGRRSGGLYYQPLILPFKVYHTPLFSLHRPAAEQITICVFCKECGSLIREYIENPAALEVKTKKR